MVPFMFLSSKSYCPKKQCLHSNVVFLKFIPDILSPDRFWFSGKEQDFSNKKRKASHIFMFDFLT